jgi:hypothetical protein
MTVALPWRKAWNPQRSIPSFFSKGWNLRFRNVSISQGVSQYPTRRLAERALERRLSETVEFVLNLESLFEQDK